MAAQRGRRKARCIALVAHDDDPPAGGGALDAVGAGRVEAPLQVDPLDHHGIASLEFLFEEGTHINVWKNRLEELRLPTGPWLTELKRRVRAGAPDNETVKVQWRTREGPLVRTFTFGELKRAVLEFVPGQKVGYVTDVAGHVFRCNVPT